MPPSSGTEATMRLVWLVALRSLAMVGLAAAVVFVPWSTLLIVFVIVVTVVASLHVTIASGTESLSRELVRVALVWAVRTGVGVLAICGYAAAIGLATLPLVGLVLIAGFFVLTRDGADAVRRAPEQPLPEDPTALTDKELCLAWRHSSARLRDPRYQADRHRLADLRSRYLDEFARRNPTAFAHWLHTAPDDDPGPHFLTGTPRRHRHR